ncbi:hypothetical protein F5887DRAFT_897413 [Amanita rubescens]|nr:hypothetical protein F5887DRAFT_907900 [Amanita rubescens]KAF8328774.1 hypothetical protein F5887DRAFT_897413 [Amanita rubescens]
MVTTWNACTKTRLLWEVIDHAFTGEEFKDFIRGHLDQMNPWLLPNAVLTMDNARIHKVAGIRMLFCCQVGNRDYVLGEMEGYANDPYALIWEAVYTTVTPEKVYGWYGQSEYIVQIKFQ